MWLRRKAYLLTFLVSLGVMSLSALSTSQGLNYSQGISSYGTVKYINIGVNYLSQWHLYSSEYTTDDILRRDFSRFQEDGINVISLSLYWFRLEGNTKGDYDGVYPSPDSTSYGKKILDDVKRVILIAYEHDIRVLVTFHTLWGNESTWCTPEYVIDPVTSTNIGLAIVRSEEMRQAFIDMFTHTVEYLNGTPGIWAWAINEPWYWPHELDPPFQNIDQKENFISLFQTLASIVKTLDGRPFTIRFVNDHKWVTDGVPKINNIFIENWGWDQRIFNALDFISLNCYLPQYPELESAWQNIMMENVMGCYEQSKEVWITEFGYDSDDDFHQAESYRKMLEVVKILPLKGYMSWGWRSDSSVLDPWLIGKSWNICANASSGDGRQSYYVLIGRDN